MWGVAKMPRDGTLRLRAFRLLFTAAAGAVAKQELRLGDLQTDQERLKAVCCSWRWRKRFSRIPLSAPSRPRARLPNDPEATLHPALQDLADILAHEADAAFRDRYYPRMPDVDVPESHVTAIMSALQREVSGEAAARGKAPPLFADLPWERQCALAERRRYWYAQYGITPQNWWRQSWSLWRVSEMPFPDGSA